MKSWRGQLQHETGAAGKWPEVVYIPRPLHFPSLSHFTRNVLVLSP